MRTTLTLLTTSAALGLAVAGCGTARAPGILTIPSAGATADSATASTTTPASTPTTPTTATATVATPSSGPLSKEPTIAAGKGAPPKQLKIKDLIKGTGATAQTGDTITVNYVGVLYSNGKVFDASWKRHETFTTPLANGSVIAGWVKGIVGMKVGGRRQLIIPPSLAYGKSGQGTIPGNATLIFDVDLLKVTKG
jgi:FKBP-type peptidyl-prolyl cis-trans isomerase